MVDPMALDNVISNMHQDYLTNYQAVLVFSLPQRYHLQQAALHVDRRFGDAGRPYLLRWRGS
jgi:hypothetical protein